MQFYFKTKTQKKIAVFTVALTVVCVTTKPVQARQGQRSTQQQPKSSAGSLTPKASAVRKSEWAIPTRLQGKCSLCTNYSADWLRCATYIPSWAAHAHIHTNTLTTSHTHSHTLGCGCLCGGNALHFAKIHLRQQTYTLHTNCTDCEGAIRSGLRIEPAPGHHINRKKIKKNKLKPQRANLSWKTSTTLAQVSPCAHRLLMKPRKMHFPSVNNANYPSLDYLLSVWGFYCDSLLFQYLNLRSPLWFTGLWKRKSTEPTVCMTVASTWSRLTGGKYVTTTGWSSCLSSGSTLLARRLARFLDVLDPRLFVGILIRCLQPLYRQCKKHKHLKKKKKYYFSS